MTAQQRQQVSVASLLVLFTILGGVAGGILTAYRVGDDRYTRIAETEKLKKDIEHLSEMKTKLETVAESVKRIEIRLGVGISSAPSSSPLASRNPSHDD